MRLAARRFVIGLLLGPALALAQEAQPARAPAQPPGPILPEGAAPRLELSSTEWDFGSKWHGEPCSGEITLRNDGDAPLEIINARSSCGCTVARPVGGGSWKGKVLAPGETEVMALSYNTKRKARHVSQTITLETNDPQRPRVAIRIKGEVKHLFEAKPGHRITFRSLDRNSAATQSIELRNNMEEPVFLKLMPVTDSSPFEVKLEEIKPGVAYKLSATTKPPLKIGANVAKIMLETGLEKYPSLTIPVSVYIAPRVAVSPQRLWVSPRLTKPSYRTVSVRYRPDHRIEIKEIKSSHPDLIKAELLPPRKRASPKALTWLHEIRVSLPPGNEFPEGGASLEIYTSDPSPEYHKLVVDIRMRQPSARPLRPNPGQARPAPPTEPAQPGAVEPTPKPGATPVEKPKDKQPSETEGQEQGGAAAP